MKRCQSSVVMAALVQPLVRWLDAVPARWLLGAFLIGVLFWACLVFGAPKAYAGEARLDWQNPTQNVDGTFIPPTGEGRLTGNRVQWSVCTVNGNFGTLVGEHVATSPIEWFTVQNLGVGNWCFRVSASTTYGESAWSGVASKQIAPVMPNPPSGLTVAAQTVYTVVKREDRFVMLPVGTAPAGTPCITDQQVNGYYVVPRSVVTWSGSVRPDVVVAPCS